MGDHLNLMPTDSLWASCCTIRLHITCQVAGSKTLGDMLKVTQLLEKPRFKPISVWLESWHFVAITYNNVTREPSPRCKFGAWWLEGPLGPFRSALKQVSSKCPSTSTFGSNVVSSSNRMLKAVLGFQGPFWCGARICLPLDGQPFALWGLREDMRLVPTLGNPLRSWLIHLPDIYYVPTMCLGQSSEQDGVVVLVELAF